MSHSMKVTILVVFVYSNQILAGISKVCFDSIHSKTEHNNSLFSLTKSNYFSIYLDIVSSFALDK